MRQTAHVRMVLRAPEHIAVRERSDDGASGAGLIAPIERGLAILAAFREGDAWLGNSEIALRTGVPKATVARLVQTLATEGFLTHSPHLRKYRLAPAVLALGYASTRSFDVAAAARPLLQRFADDCGVFSVLAGRGGLDTTITLHCHSATTLLTPAVGEGTRFPLEGSPLGLALLAGLPEGERDYLLDRICDRIDAAARIALRQRMADALDQVEQRGYCASVGDWGAGLAVVAAPLILPDHPAFAVGCAAPASALPRARLVECVGPRLSGLVESLRSLEAEHA